MLQQPTPGQQFVSWQPSTVNNITGIAPPAVRTSIPIGPSPAYQTSSIPYHPSYIPTSNYTSLGGTASSGFAGLGTTSNYGTTFVPTSNITTGIIGSTIPASNIPTANISTTFTSTARPLGVSPFTSTTYTSTITRPVSNTGVYTNPPPQKLGEIGKDFQFNKATDFSSIQRGGSSQQYSDSKESNFIGSSNKN